VTPERAGKRRPPAVEPNDQQEQKERERRSMSRTKGTWTSAALARERASQARLALGLVAAALAALLTGGAPPVAAQPEGCPNAALRGTSRENPATHQTYSNGLPDCRAYELVTPPFKFGQLTFNLTLPNFLDESHLVVSSVGAFAEPGGDPGTEGADYLLSRGAGSWSPTALNLPRSQFGGIIGFGPSGEVADLNNDPGSPPTDFSRTVIANVPRGAKVIDERLYLRQGRAAGATCPAPAIEIPSACLLEVGPMLPRRAVESWKEAPYGTSPEHAHIFYRGASHDLTHVLFGSSPGGATNWLWPEDTNVGGGGSGDSLYEYVGTGNSTPSLVGLDNTGQLISQCGISLGSYDSSRERESFNVYNAISAAGSTVFFTAPHRAACAGSSPAVNQVFARMGDPGAARATVNVAGTASCSVSPSCDVTSDVTYDGASSDGAKVLVTTSQALAPGDLDNTSDIYECELPGDARPTPTPTVAFVNPCPSLKPVSVTGTAAGAEVESVIAISQDGSAAYFTAGGVLASNENANGETATHSAHNLYVYEPDGSNPGQFKTRFIGKLSSSRPKAEATPDGRFLLFASSNALTPDAKGSSEQLYRYDAREQRLVRVSVGENGLHDNEEGSRFEIVTPPGRSATDSAAPGAVAISDDGQYVFFQSPTGLTPEAPDNQVVGCETEFEGECLEAVLANNVYEYHEGHVQLISPPDLHVTHGASTVTLLGASRSGEDVYFQTAEQLVGQDTDTQQDVYDARVHGGFPAPASATGPSCSAECQGPTPAPPLFQAPGSATFSGPGNAVSAPGKPAVVTTRPKPTTKPLTRAQKLARALKACKHKPTKRRVRCVRRARKLYSAKRGR
jgi:hypothetical protein